MNGGKKHELLANFLLLLFCFIFFAILMISSIVGGGLLIATYTALPFWGGIVTMIVVYLALGIIITLLAGYTAKEMQ